MEPITNAKNLALYWVQPKASQRYFLLLSDEREFASLEFQSAFGSLAVAITTERQWSFKRVGFFNPRVTVRRLNEEIDLAVYHPRWTGSEGTLSMAGGRSFTWKATNFWATCYTFLDSAGEQLLWFKEGAPESRFSNLFKIQAKVDIEAAGWQLPDLELLLALGWYLLILRHEDAAAGAAAAAAV